MNIYSQSNSNKIYYKAEGITQLFMNTKSEILINRPYGNKVNIEFDTFFKSYYITYYNEKGEYTYFRLSFLKDIDGQIRMNDENNVIYNVIDNINKNGSLIIQLDQRIDNNSMILGITKVVKIN